MTDKFIASGHIDGSIRLWSGKQRSLIYRFAKLHDDSVTSLCINALTSTITSVGKDHSVRLIDYRDFSILDEVWPDEYINIKHSSESISCGSYSQHIVIASADENLLIYNLEKESREKGPKRLAVGRSQSMFQKDNFQFFNSAPLKLKLAKVIDSGEKRGFDKKVESLLSSMKKSNHRTRSINCIA